MAVFTPVTRAELAHWLEQFSVGALLHLEGISAGIENSNFFVGTDQGEYVLTIFERLEAHELPFYLELMRHLAQRGIACPTPSAAKDGALFKPLIGKPAALVSRLSGQGNPCPGTRHCADTAMAMAKMHLAAQDFAMKQDNPRGLPWCLGTTPKVVDHLDAPLAKMLEDEMREVALHYGQGRERVPFGPIHADLFRDNVLFSGEKLGGFIDFYFAGCDAWLFDVAVSINDWCIVQESGVIDPVLGQVFLAAYAKVRPFTQEERTLWPWALRAAALRFWLSRLADIVLPRSATLLTPHDPRHFERIVMHRRAEAHTPILELPHA